jgi:hypothetical protein
MGSFLEFQDIDEDYLSWKPDRSGPRLLSFLNKTNTLGFAYPNRFNHTFVAFLSGAILFALVNAAFLMTYISSKRHYAKPDATNDGKGNNRKKDSRRKPSEDGFQYEEYYDYDYYDDILYDILDRSTESPR